MTTMQVNLHTAVNSKSIQKAVMNGREHYIIPSFTLPADVIMNGGLYPSSEIDATFKSIEGTVAPLGHPSVNGEFVSALTPEGLNVGYVGAWNKRAEKRGNRVYVEKWVDIEKANESDGGKRLIERIEALLNGESVEPIHTSTGVILERLEPNEMQRAQGAEWVAKINRFDHDAILLDEVGAATPEQGVGIMVNTASAKSLKPVVNAGALQGESYRDKERELDKAIKERFGTASWAADFTDAQVVVYRNSGEYEIFTYSKESGIMQIIGDGEKVESQQSWVKRVANFFKNKQEPKPVTNQKTEADMALTDEDKAGLMADLSKVIGEAIAPLAGKVEAMEANNKALADKLQANQEKADAEKRAVVSAKLGEVVANALSGTALDEAWAKCSEAASAQNPALEANAADVKPASYDHLGG